MLMASLHVSKVRDRKDSFGSSKIAAAAAAAASLARANKAHQMELNKHLRKIQDCEEELVTIVVTTKACCFPSLLFLSFPQKKKVSL